MGFILPTLFSTLYHFLDDGFEISEKMRNWFENLDHFSIYLFIATLVRSPHRVLFLGTTTKIQIGGIQLLRYKERLEKRRG